MRFDDLLKETTERLGPLKAYITKKYSEMDVAEMVDEAAGDFIDDDWEEDGDYESDLEWYEDYGHGEAEDQVMNRLTKEAMSATKVKLNTNEQIKFDEWLQDKYHSLYYR
jgi:hypothetical protein